MNIWFRLLYCALIGVAIAMPWSLGPLRWSVVAVGIVVALSWDQCERAGRRQGWRDQHLVVMECSCGWSITASLHQVDCVEDTVTKFHLHEHLTSERSSS